MSRSLPAAGLVTVTRPEVDSGRQLDESHHVGHVAVVGDGGRLLAGLGDPSHPTFVRSAAKPLQATACLEVLDRAGAAVPDGRELAVGWASHRAEPEQLAAVRALLAASGTSEEALTCPPGVGDADPGATPRRVQFNCSGKHALFALAGTALGCSPDRLLDPDGPLQREVLAVLEETLGPLRGIGVDGCGAPAVVADLDRLAGAFRAVASDERFARVRAAGFAHPRLVAGRGRLASALLAAGVVAKDGAEGVFAAGWMRDGRAFGAAVKCADGASRGADVALNALLERAGVVPPRTWRTAPPLGGEAHAGTLRPTAALLELAAAVRH